MIRSLQAIGWLISHAAMRRSIIAVLCIFFSALPAVGQIAEGTGIFDRGTLALQQGTYLDAVQIFSEADSLSIGSSGLFYNRAIAHYRLNQIGEAIRYFRRAQLLDPEDPRIEHSLSIVSSRLEDQFSDLPSPIWTRLQRIVTDRLEVNTLILLGILFYAGFMSLMIVKIKRSSTRVISS